MFPDEIVTPRLRFRAMSREVVDPIASYDYFAASRSDTIEEETEYVSWNPHQTPNESFDFLKQAEKGHKTGENAIYAIFPRDGEDGAGEFAGTTGFNPEWNKRRAVFGMWLRKKFWGRGYSGERAAALFAAVFDVFDLEVASVQVEPENDKSIRAIEKYIDRFGGQHDGLFRNAICNANGTPRDVHTYSVTREQWLDATGGDYDAEFHWEDRE
ncbi:acetyltransferase, ribosomal protein N-acetylase [Haloferax mucosum ATCC BAA-1512]|uniref:Acetyltransferase, ribosomal protein N-acetylase n=1 Tax=Haloferax mucosum ATCC BAA-1512 TaxID=662479 RepID=M0IJ39_9EURY|nr:GNAT family protein [Haloferax mucosum]ELZ96780.1 acetyltransferase, ribosomal protein N-acetylase [Haloferax mucosum ATCC BAA-1512]